MASPKSIILLITFLLAALEMARSSEVNRCETKEDCRSSGKVYCPAVLGIELTCADGKCACVGRYSKALPPFRRVAPIKFKCNTDKDCRDNLSIRCLNPRTKCHNGRCRCSG